MGPHLRIELRSEAYPWLWVKFVRGFSPSACCAKSLIGRYWKAIPLKREAGNVFEGDLEFDEPFVYACGVHRGGYGQNLHLPMERSPASQWKVDLPDILVEVKGLRLMPIVPLPEAVASSVTANQARCRNYQWAASVWPGRLETPLFDAAKSGNVD
jgi:hypothetical protein